MLHQFCVLFPKRLILQSVVSFSPFFIFLFFLRVLGRKSIKIYIPYLSLERRRVVFGGRQTQHPCDHLIPDPLHLDAGKSTLKNKSGRSKGKIRRRATRGHSTKFSNRSCSRFRSSCESCRSRRKDRRCE